MADAIKLRAHHGMCIAFFEGKGYSDAFVGHMRRVIDMLQADPVVHLAAQADAVCAKCPNLVGGTCKTARLVENFDLQVLAVCGLTMGAELRWRDFSSLVEEKILSAGKRADICGRCEWDFICREKERRYCQSK